MDLHPKIEPVSSTSHESFNHMSISELVSDLRANCDKVEEVFFAREAKHKAEIGSLAVKYELERLQRLHIEDELKKKEEQHLYLERKWLDDIADSGSDAANWRRKRRRTWRLFRN
ncbi:hypothetical protein PIB30_047519 [Stylosanthes scabra]|uniref:Uncharacterized protein n=1 Tax=Stylosanthes scabra TaxID=79078 RepID=A0ABU6XGZ1_9FABA|nr:hypothetical protein [Stylosanthes scabra]